MHPYNECKGPINVYRKIKEKILPKCFYLIEDQEVKEFLALCLGDAETRPTASELLEHQFLEVDENDPRVHLPVSLLNAHEFKKKAWVSSFENSAFIGDDSIEIDIIIHCDNGTYRHVKFPFSFMHDSPSTVADEMVVELQINPMLSLEISEIIKRKIIQAVSAQSNNREQLTTSEVSPSSVHRNSWSVDNMQVKHVNEEFSVNS